MHLIRFKVIILCMLKDYLDLETYNLIVKNFSFSDITEIRMRVNKKLVIVIKNKKYFLYNSQKEYVIVTKFMLENFIKRACENSMYAYNKNICDGYLSLAGGIRVGICGEVVAENEKVITIKNFQAINIRIPHIIKNCSLIAYDYLVDSDVKNTLIISSPGSGKTTFLRDFIFQISNSNLAKNILIADERNEICSMDNGENNLDVGEFCDIYTNCSKKFAFTKGIRSMRPDVIITDEIDLENDLSIILEAINCGVNVVATIHAKDIEQLKKKTNFDYILKYQFFSRFVILTSDEGPGTLTKIYDEKLNIIYCR